MRYSAFAHYLETKYDKLEDSFYHSNEVSRAIIREFVAVCRGNGITPVVAGIYDDTMTRAVLDYCSKLGIPVVDISVDLNVDDNRNYPYDSHPSPRANRQYAEKLESFLSKSLLNKSQ